jgi:hypothetical protein
VKLLKDPYRTQQRTREEHTSKEDRRNKMLMRSTLNIALRNAQHYKIAATAMKSIAAIQFGRPERFFHSTTVHNAKSALATDPTIIKAGFRELLAKEREQALLGGGQRRIDKLHEKGRLTARERLELLFDSGTFQELDLLKAHRCTEFDVPHIPGDGIVTGHGYVNGRLVYGFRYVS